MQRITSFISFMLVITGALNWLMVGLLRFDLVRWIFGRGSRIGRIVYSLVGTAGLTQLTTYLMRVLRGRQPAPVTG